MKVAFVFALLLLINSVAFADPITFTALLNGPNEPTPSLGTGLAAVIIDPVAHTLMVSATFSGLTSGTTAAHIHCCTATPLTGTAGVATQVPAFTNFQPLFGMTAGSFTQTYDTTQALLYNPAFVTAQGGIPQAEAALFAGIMAGTTYFNIHTTMFPGGEIRGFLTPVAVPEPTTVVLLGSGLLGILGLYRKRRTI
jgi:CHRD domain/PEP-CTERM motif